MQMIIPIRKNNHQSIRWTGLSEYFAPEIQHKNGKTNGDIASLESVLTYSNSRVVERFRKEYGTTKDETQVIFQDMLRWLWINALHTYELKAKEAECPRYLGIRAEQVVIDEMWHIFLLYTSDYREFCQNYFGVFIDHSPNDRMNESISVADLERHLISYLTYVERHLGQETLLRWFDEFAVRYSAESLHQRRIIVLKQNIQMVSF